MRDMKIQGMNVILALIMITAALASLCKSETYFVKPSYPPDHNFDCPVPCNDFVYYIEGREQFNGNVVIIVLEGYHDVQGKRSIDFDSNNPGEIQYVHIMGNGSRSDVVVFNLNLALSESHLLIMENILIQNSSIVTSTSPYKLKNITILNCFFVNSHLILTYMVLSIKDSTFVNSTSTSIKLYSSIVTFAGNVKFQNNHGSQGGALLLFGTIMQISRNTNLLFIDNHAKETGGAIHVVFPEVLINELGYLTRCFYQILGLSLVYNHYLHSQLLQYQLSFVNNSASNGGDHIYGASLKSRCIVLSDCDRFESIDVVNSIFTFDPHYPSTFSAVSADPTQVCTCNNNGQPHCHEREVLNIKTYPGSPFTVPVILVGGDHGTAVGTIYAKFNESYLPWKSYTSLTQRRGIIINNSTECTNLEFKVYLNTSSVVMYLATKEDFQINEFGFASPDHHNIIPLIVNITLLKCPVGFIMLGDPPGCHCHPVLAAANIKCTINGLTGYHTWNSSVWLQAKESVTVRTFFLGTHCPLQYCTSQNIMVNLRNPDAQCDFNRAGVLCGSCKENYSLAIGSSNCIYCPNNNNLALLIFFATAGVMLIFLIAALNLTVTQGTINSLVFYANIVWAYQGILFPPSFGKGLIAHKTFIAWLNLDFGIETCFISGMNAYLKTWLQFLFPFYTASLFFVGVRYSSKLSKLLGSRSVPTLATILFLAYSKLLRTIIACLQLSMYYTYSASTATSSTTFVWAIDGNYQYGKYPHIFLLLAAIICFLILWMPYTLLLVSRQWVRRVDHHGPLKHIARYKPFYDACFAPLKDKHHYWFGVLLIVQGLLLLVSSLTSNALPSVSVLLLLGISFCLLCYVNSIRPYKSASVALLESSFLINFIMLAVGHLYFRSTNNIRGRSILLSLSITVAFIEFCGIIIWNLVPQKLKKCRRKSTRSNELEEDNIHILQELPRDESEHSVSYHEISISELISQEETRADKCDTTESLQ